MKKVLNIVPYPFLPYSSGGQKLIALFNEYLGTKTNLHVAGTTDNVTKDISSYVFHPVLSYSRWRYLNPLIPIKLIRLIKKNKIETVILEHPYYGWLIPFFRLFTRVSIICHTHNVESERFRSIGKKWWQLLAYYEGIVLRHCDQVLCITDEDRQFFIDKMRVPKNNCIIVPYGIEQREAPSDKEVCKRVICEKHQLDPSLPLLFFNGALNYKPNSDALDIILKEILPRLIKNNFKTHIIIAGRGLSEEIQSLISAKKEIIYTGFVDDINTYTKAADILLNPVMSGGGIKTKMIEALGMGTSVVSTVSGAAGADLSITDSKLITVHDQDWDSFAEKIIEAAASANKPTPPAFYERYYWGHIINGLLHL